MAKANEAFNLLRDLRLERDHIHNFLNDTFGATEKAAEDLFSNQDASSALEKLDQLNTLLKQCMDRFSLVNSTIDSSEPICLQSKTVCQSFLIKQNIFY